MPQFIFSVPTHPFVPLYHRHTLHHRCASSHHQHHQTEPQQPQPQSLSLTAALESSIESIGRQAWDACHDGTNPFISYDFLQALEESGSVTPQRGWLPRHLCLRCRTSSPDTTNDNVVACVIPMYAKGHSMGEYVFDSSWAEAYDNHFVSAGWPGSNDNNDKNTKKNNPRGYYPKLQACVPFTPVTGPRILVNTAVVQHQEDRERVLGAVAGTLASLPGDFGVSSLHMTFNTEEEYNLLSKYGAVERIGVQYHWENLNYSKFSDFEAALQQKRRKSVRQERKKASNEFDIQRLTGDAVRNNTKLWDLFYSFYIDTIERKWGSVYLTREFFDLISQRMSDKIMLVTATPRNGGNQTATPVAAALNFLGSDTIYGRNWGAAPGLAEQVKNLHMELCYYQAIEHAIEHGYRKVEAGAQGQHKLARGYLPSLTYSSHFIPNDEFRIAVEGAMRYEREELMYYAETATVHESPYKNSLSSTSLPSISLSSSSSRSDSIESGEY